MNVVFDEVIGVYCVNRVRSTTKECAWHCAVFGAKSCVGRVYTGCSSNHDFEVSSLPDVTLCVPTFQRGVMPSKVGSYLPVGTGRRPRKHASLLCHCENLKSCVVARFNVMFRSLMSCL